MAKKKRLSLREYADRRGVSMQRVCKVLKEGKITAKKINGRFELYPEQADQEWADNVDEKSRPRSLRGQDDNAPQDDNSANAVSDSSDEKVTNENASKKLRIAEAEKEIWKAKQAQLDYEEQSGKLVAIDKVRKEAFSLARIVRDSILNIPDRISAELCGITDQHTMHSVLTKELTQALQELANALEKKK